MTEKFKWSPELKLKQITINGNVITRKTKPGDQNNFSQFCLLNQGFSKTLNKKQSWKIKINKKKGEISLGIALKNKMQSQNFTGKNITWTETGHGIYVNDHDGCCNSHSEKEFNCEDCGLEYDEGDVIMIKYDPLGYKIRLGKNDNEDQFEMPIQAPPQYDAYHLCVQLYGEELSVELLLS